MLIATVCVASGGGRAGHCDSTGRARLATRLPPTGSIDAQNTIGMTDVACFAATAAAPTVTMTSTLSRTNSAAISA